MALLMEITTGRLSAQRQKTEQFSSRKRLLQVNCSQRRQNRDKSGSSSALLSEWNRLIDSATFIETFQIYIDRTEQNLSQCIAGTNKCDHDVTSVIFPNILTVSFKANMVEKYIIVVFNCQALAYCKICFDNNFLFLEVTHSSLWSF